MGLLFEPIKIVIEAIVSLVEIISNVVSNIYNAILDIVSRLNPFSDKFILKDLLGFIVTIINYLNPFHENFLLKPVLDMILNVLSYLNPSHENFLLKPVINLILSVLDYINPFSDNFLLKIAFVPKDGFFSEKFNKLLELIYEKFPFIQQLASVVNPSTMAVEISERAPSLSFTLPPKYGGGTYQLVDFSYFEQYRDFILNFIRVVIWFPFLKWLYGRIPSIINGGMGMDYRNKHTIEMFDQETGESLGKGRTNW